MERAIVGLHRTGPRDAVAELSCGHRRPLGPDAVEGADRRVLPGRLLDCPGCARREMPEGHAPYRKTPCFDRASLPAALQREHRTRPGVWAWIHVLHGGIGYRVDAPFHERRELSPGVPGLVLPEVPHRLELTGPVELYVEFWRAAPAGSGDGGAR